MADRCRYGPAVAIVVVGECAPVREGHRGIVGVRVDVGKCSGVTWRSVLEDRREVLEILDDGVRDTAVAKAYRPQSTWRVRPNGADVQTGGLEDGCDS